MSKEAAAPVFAPEERLDAVRNKALEFMRERNKTRGGSDQPSAPEQQAAPSAPQPVQQPPKGPAPLPPVAPEPPKVAASDEATSQAPASGQKQGAGEAVPPSSATEAHERALAALRRYGFGESETRGWSLDQIHAMGNRLLKMQEDFDGLKGKLDKPPATAAAPAGTAGDAKAPTEQALQPPTQASDLESYVKRAEAALEQMRSLVDETAEKQLNSKRAELASAGYPQLATDAAAWERVEGRVKRLLAGGGYSSRNQLVRDAALLELGQPVDVREEAERDRAKPTTPVGTGLQPGPDDRDSRVWAAAKHLQAHRGDIRGARRAMGT